MLKWIALMLIVAGYAVQRRAFRPGTAPGKTMLAIGLQAVAGMALMGIGAGMIAALVFFSI